MRCILIVLLSLYSWSSFAKSTQTVYVYAASSMTQVVQQLTAVAAEQGIEVKGVFGSSSSIARQISNGAPADIFISANQQWMAYVEPQYGVQPSHIIASNRLVAITADHLPTIPIEDLSKPERWQQIIGHGRIAVGETHTVPVGIYAKEALQSMGVWPVLQQQIAPMKNTRAVLAMVERGQVPVGIVYATDANLSTKVKVLAPIPRRYYSHITYPMLLLSDKAHAHEVYHIMLSPLMQQRLSELGFSPIENANAN
ncbi:molybdate ABC transporter substrate-binding protein [Vibrio rarus]|uniref:molybdate ABC transporter substrate-binding protein n=1 Tax=Vibrio rarus TaxID=413403 RepID=UPI0021C2F331|nr:molybdate ABC transporter substrate-binding protein [Vibrio rarus]